ncbi:MAG: CopG/DNA-binding domain-containing protein [Fusobacteria bacterium]|nr:MAG: CopG/DNA-binding domain-containing protein [Fusobacteriota bacterium]KAF0230267.1 MAG: CopG/DNA-binding domain-containing [Fusobacteriota bacterium]
MGTISVRLSEKDDKLIRKYAELNSIDLSSLVREAVIEKIEEDYDLTLFDKVWKMENGKDRVSHEDLKRELGL